MDRRESIVLKLLAYCSRRGAATGTDPENLRTKDDDDGAAVELMMIFWRDKGMTSHVVWVLTVSAYDLISITRLNYWMDGKRSHLTTSEAVVEYPAIVLVIGVSVRCQIGGFADQMLFL